MWWPSQHTLWGPLSAQQGNIISMAFHWRADSDLLCDAYWGNVIVFKFLFVSFSLLYIDRFVCELLASEVGVVLACLYSVIADLQRMKDNKCGSRGGNRGSGHPPPGKYKKLGCLSNTGPDPLKITKLPSPH